MTDNELNVVISNMITLFGELEDRITKLEETINGDGLDG